MEELSLKKFEEAAEKVKEVTLATNLVYSEYFSNQSGNKVYLKAGNIQAAEGEVISPKRLTKHRLYVKNSQGEELGYLSFRDDCMYYVVIPLMEQRRVKVRMKAAEGKKAACQKLNFYVKLLEKDTAGMPESVNLQIEQLLNDYTR